MARFLIRTLVTESKYSVYTVEQDEFPTREEAEEIISSHKVVPRTYPAALPGLHEHIQAVSREDYIDESPSRRDRFNHGDDDLWST